MNDKQVVPANYYDFAWKGTQVKSDYGGLWWVHPHHSDAPKDLVQTAGFRNNHGFAVSSLDLVFIRLGLGYNYPKDFESELVKKVPVEIERLIAPRHVAAEHAQVGEQRRRPLRPRGADHPLVLRFVLADRG